MKQFDVFKNPVAAATRQFPYLIVLQADVIGSTDRVIAPLSELKSATTQRISPKVTIKGRNYHVLVLGLTTIRVRDLKVRVANAAEIRDNITSALDLLFQGV